MPYNACALSTRKFFMSYQSQIKNLVLISLLSASLCPTNLQAAPVTKVVPDTRSDSMSAMNDQLKQLMNQGRAKEALVLAQEMVKRKPKDPLPHQALTAIYMQLGNGAEAEREALAAVKLGSKAGFPHYNLAVIYTMRGQFAQAEKEFQLAIKLAAQDKVKGAKLVQNAEKAYCQCLFQMGKADKAHGLIDSLTKKYPNDPEIWLLLTKAYLVEGKKDKAELALKTCLSINPNFYPGVMLKADWMAGTNQYKEAQALGQRLLEIDPKNPFGYLFLAQFSVNATNDPNLGRLCLEKAKAAKGDDAKFLFALADVFAHRQAKEGTKDQGQNKAWRNLAEDALKASVKADPNQFPTNFILAQLLFEDHRASEAEPYAKKCLILDPNNKQAAQLYKQTALAKRDFAAMVREWFSSVFH